MEEPEAIVIQKKQAAIKLAKNLEPFNYKLGQEYDAIYVETLTEDIKQLARELKKFATVFDIFCKQKALTDPPMGVPIKPPEVEVDGESDRVTKLMRRYTKRIQTMADLLYEVAFMDFEGLQQEELKDIMEVEEGDDDE